MMAKPRAKPKQKQALYAGQAGSVYDVTPRGVRRVSSARARVKQGDNKHGGRKPLSRYGT